MERVISKDIVLKNLKVSDAFALFNAVDSSRENLSKYMPWEKSVVDLESARAYIEGRLNSGIEGSQWFAVHFKKQFSGVFGVKSIHRETRVCELGYWLADSATGNRVVGQILEVLVPTLASEQGLKAFEFHCLESNLASVKIAKRAGATLKSKGQHTLDVPEKEQSMCIYALEL